MRSNRPAVDRGPALFLNAEARPSRTALAAWRQPALTPSAQSLSGHGQHPGHGQCFCRQDTEMGKLKLFLLLKQEQGFSGKCSETMLPPTSAVLGSQTREQLSESFFGLPRPND